MACSSSRKTIRRWSKASSRGSASSASASPSERRRRSAGAMLVASLKDWHSHSRHCQRQYGPKGLFLGVIPAEVKEASNSSCEVTVLGSVSSSTGKTGSVHSLYCTTQESGRDWYRF